MFRRLLRYPYGNVRSRALAAGLQAPEVIKELIRSPTAEQALAEMVRALGLPAGGEAALDAGYRAFGRKIVNSLPAVAGGVVQAYLNRGAVENLKVLCRALLVGDKEAAVQWLLPAGAREIVPEEAAQAKDPEQLANLLPRGPWREALHAALRDKSEDRLFSVETALDRVFWEDLTERINNLSPFDRQAAREVLGERADVDRLRTIGRGLQAGRPAQNILAALPPLGSLFSRQRLQRAFRSAEPEAALRQLLPAGAPPDPFSPEGEIFLFRRLARSLRRHLISTPLDIAVPLSALLLKELETRNLLGVLGGLRFGAEGDRIPAFLILDGG